MTQDSTLDKKVTIVIPTKERASKLAKTLDYYTRTEFKGDVIVADSSTEQASDVDELVQSASTNGLNIRLCKCIEQMHDGDAVKKANNLINTDYAMYCGDDDIAVQSGVMECVKFLEHNPEYTAASGVKGTEVGNQNRSQVQYTSCLQVEADSVVERFASYIRARICTTYYVHRTPTWIAMFEHADRMPNRWLGGEVLPCCISVMSGKIKDALSDRTTLAIYRIDTKESWIQNVSLFDMMFSHDYVDSLGIMKEVVVPYLVQDGISEALAEKIYDKEMWLSTVALLLNRFVERYPHLKQVIDMYSQSLESYPFEWLRPTMSDAIIGDEHLFNKLEQLNNIQRTDTQEG